MVRRGTPRPAPLVDAVRSGDRAALEAIRDRLAEELASPECFGVAGIARELRAVLADLAALPVAKGSVVDELDEKRRARRAAAAGS